MRQLDWTAGTLPCEPVILPLTLSLQITPGGRFHGDKEAKQNAAKETDKLS